MNIFSAFFLLLLLLADLVPQASNEIPMIGKVLKLKNNLKANFLIKLKGIYYFINRIMSA